jgi:hypothetical protein
MSIEIKIDEEMKTEFGEFLDGFLPRYNLSYFERPKKRMELFDISVWKCFPELWVDEEDELGQIFDKKYAEMTKEIK